MHILRTSSMLVRTVLAWFVLTLGAASAAPMAQAATMALVCSDGGVKLVLVEHEGGAARAHGHTLDCPLCLPAAILPALAPPCAPLPPAAAAAPAMAPASHLAVRPGAPLPARGPPYRS